MAVTCCRARRCSPTALRSGWPGSRADVRWPTPSPVNPAERAAISPPPGPPHPTLSPSVANLTPTLTRGPVVGVDLNEGHLAVRRLDEHGNPVRRPHRIDIDLTGPSTRRDAQVRHAITRLIHYTRRHR